MNKMLGIDLGTSYTRLCLKNEGVVLRAPSVISFENRTGEVLAVGLDAKRMIGRTPPNISAVKPIRSGVVSNIGQVGLMVGALLTENHMTSTFRRPAVLAAMPFGASESERRALEDALFEAGASSVALVEQPLAAALGAGMKIMSARGGMLVDIGAGSIQVAIVSHGGVVISGSLKSAGEAMTEAVVRSVIQNHQILIGEMTAETIKVKLGTLAETDRGFAPISGKSTKMGGAAKATVSSTEIREALLPTADAIVDTIRRSLETMPPELSADIAEYGILLCGGGALIPGMADYLKQALHMNVAVAKDPLDCVILGLHRIMNGGREARRFIVSYSK